MDKEQIRQALEKKLKELGVPVEDIDKALLDYDALAGEIDDVKALERFGEQLVENTAYKNNIAPDDGMEEYRKILPDTWGTEPPSDKDIEDFFNEEIGDPNKKVIENPDGSTTEITNSTYTDDLGIEHGITQEVNKDVPIDEFKTVFSNSRPSDHPMPKILDDIKDTQTYKSAQFQLWAMELEYQDRQKFKTIVERQYEIYYEFLEENPDISIKDKETLLEEVRKRTLMLDEQYRKFTVKNDVDLSLEELTTFDNELDDINKNFKGKLEGALDNIKLGLPNDLNRDIRHLQIEELDLSDEHKKYLNEIMKDTDTRLRPDQIRQLDEALSTTNGKETIEKMITSLRDNITKHGSNNFHKLLIDNGANYFDVMAAKQDIAQQHWNRIDEILFNPDVIWEMQYKSAKSELVGLGLSDKKIEDILKNHEFFKGRPTPPESMRIYTDDELTAITNNKFDKIMTDDAWENIIANYETGDLTDEEIAELRSENPDLAQKMDEYDQSVADAGQQFGVKDNALWSNMVKAGAKLLGAIDEEIIYSPLIMAQKGMKALGIPGAGLLGTGISGILAYESILFKGMVGMAVLAHGTEMLKGEVERAPENLELIKENTIPAMSNAILGLFGMGMPEQLTQSHQKDLKPKSEEYEASVAEQGENHKNLLYNQAYLYSRVSPSLRFYTDVLGPKFGMYDQIGAIKKVAGMGKKSGETRSYNQFGVND